MAFTIEQIDQAIAERGRIACIGQIDAAGRRHLDGQVSAGRLVKYRGHWHTHGGFGLGPLKTIYALAEAAGHAALAVSIVQQARDAANRMEGRS